MLVPFFVQMVCQTEDYCNLTLETAATMFPENKHKMPFSAVNAQMTLRANLGDDTAFRIEISGEASRIVPPI